MAFGTGNHETTRLCLERLTGIASGLEAAGRTPSSVGVIDAGCGSGILAISAAALGFDPILAFDLDPEAVRASRENAAINGLEDRLELLVGGFESGLKERRADVVLANIQSDVLMRFSTQLIQAVKSGGVLVLSGILGSELEEVRAAFRSALPEAPIESSTLGEWADLLVRP
jgi:ribosomal protein L11 methyltransferase